MQHIEQQAMTELTDVLKREYEATEKFHSCLKVFNKPEDRKVKIIVITQVCIEGQLTTIET